MPGKNRRGTAIVVENLRSLPFHTVYMRPPCVHDVYWAGHSIVPRGYKYSLVKLVGASIGVGRVEARLDGRSIVSAAVADRAKVFDTECLVGAARSSSARPLRPHRSRVALRSRRPHRPR